MANSAHRPDSDPGQPTAEERADRLARELTETNFRLNQTQAQLETLNQAGLNLAASPQAQDVVGEYLQLAVAMVDASGGFFFLKDESSNRFELAAQINLAREQLDSLDDRPFRNKLRRAMRDHSALLLGGDDLPRGFSNGELLVAPAGTHGFLGVIDKESRDGLQPFSDDDARLLQVMGQQAGMTLANARMYRRMVEERNLNLNIFNSVATGVVSTDLHGTIVRVNPATKRILGTKGTFFARSSARLFEQYGCGRTAAAVADCLQDGQERFIDGERIASSELTLNTRISSLRTEAGQIEGLVITLEDLTEQNRLRTMFKQYASDQVVDLVLKDDAAPVLGGEIRTATMLFVDLVGSTELLGRIGGEEMVSIMNDFFTRMVDIVFSHNGTLDKYMGDGFLAVYGAPVTLEQDSARAVQTGLDILAEMESFNHSTRQSLGVSIGISRGTVVAGNIGSLRRMEYSVIGPDVNIASRLCDRARSGELLVSSRVYDEVGDAFESEHAGRLPFKGMRQPMDIYRVLGIEGSVVHTEGAGEPEKKQTAVVDLSVPMIADMELTVSRTAEAVAEFMGMPDEKIQEIRLALVEACINSFEHSQSKDRRLQVDFAVSERDLTIAISDRGHGFDVKQAVEKMKARRERGDMKRGWGLELMGELMDEVDIDSDADGTILTLVKYR